MDDFKNRDKYDESIEKDDDFLLVFLICHSFERVGFDSKVDKCIKRFSRKMVYKN